MTSCTARRSPEKKYPSRTSAIDLTRHCRTRNAIFMIGALHGWDGPGAGRPTKLYQRVPGDLAVSVPERQYALAGHVLVRAIGASQRENVPPEEAVEQVALAMGHEAGAAVL